MFNKNKDMYEVVKKSGVELVNNPTEINKRIYNHQRKILKKKKKLMH